MSDRFEFISRQIIKTGEKKNPGTSYEYDENEYDENVGEAVVLRDKQTGVMYLWSKEGNCGGLTVLVDKDGKPMTTFKVSI